MAKKTPKTPKTTKTTAAKAETREDRMRAIDRESTERLLYSDRYSEAAHRLVTYVERCGPRDTAAFATFRETILADLDARLVQAFEDHQRSRAQYEAEREARAAEVYDRHQEFMT